VIDALAGGCTTIAELSLEFLIRDLVGIGGDEVIAKRDKTLVREGLFLYI
tara:strand:- start:695 stop:844 length:150 start_codon:yes stop_codon:yes gene_type:complete